MLCGGRVVDEKIFSSKNNIPSVGRKSVKSQLLDETKFIVNDQSEATNVIGIIEGKIITDHLNESIPIPSIPNTFSIKYDPAKNSPIR